jgi:hypothetical protein
MFCLATKILTYLPFFYLIIFMTSNCQDALGFARLLLHGDILAKTQKGRLKFSFRRPFCFYLQVDSWCGLPALYQSKKIT